MSSTTRVGIIGYGYIGQAIHTLLKKYQKYPTTFEVSVYDVNPLVHNDYPDVEILNGGKYEPAVMDNDIIIAATPYFSNIGIAEECFKHNVAYFDLTEDVAITNEIHQLCEQYNGTCMTQCGLAPGAVGVIAKLLMDELHYKHNVDMFLDVELRVGALPVSANNEIKYYFSWSPEGLINEYCNPCETITYGSHKSVDPLEGVETIVIDGVEYEAFNTSGGLGSLLSSLKKKQYSVINANYKTIRYRGHREKMSFLLNELGLKHRQDLLLPILRRAVPHIHNDVVVMFVQVIGRTPDNRLLSRQYSKRIYGIDDMSAIQLTTAAGVCAAVHWFARFGTGAKGVLSCEEITECISTNPFWNIVYDKE